MHKISNRAPTSTPKTTESRSTAPAPSPAAALRSKAQEKVSSFARDGFEKEPTNQVVNDGFVIPNKNGKVTGKAAGTPAAGTTVNEQYFGGGVLTKPVVTNMYIGDYFNSAAGQKDVAHNDAFMTDLVGNKDFNSVIHQYGGDTGSTQASHVIPGAVKSNASIKQSQIETMLQTAIKNGTVKPGDQSLYNFVLPPGATLVTSDGTTSKQGLGGFHGSIHTPDGKEVFYSAIAYSKGKNGIDFTKGNAQDNISITESHEYAEAVTDPHVQDAVNANDNSKLGWMDLKSGEIGDVEVNDAAPGTPLSTMYGTMDGYAVQKIWSQKDGTNEIRAKVEGPVEPLPKPAK